MADVFTKQAMSTILDLQKFQIVDGKCSMSDYEIGRMIAKTDKSHKLGLDIVTKAIEQLPNEPTDEMSQQLAQQMQAVVLVGAASDGMHIARSLCKRLESGLKIPGNKLPGLGG